MTIKQAIKKLDKKNLYAIQSLKTGSVYIRSKNETGYFFQSYHSITLAAKILCR
jgi:hypothetical protein